MATDQSPNAALLEAALRLSRPLLGWFGGFHPWAIALQRDGSIESVFAGSEELPDGAPLIELLREQVGALAGGEGLAAVAIVYDALVRDPRTDALQDAIAVEIATGEVLELQRLVTVPYVVDPDGVRFGAAHASSWTGGS